MAHQEYQEVCPELIPQFEQQLTHPPLNGMGTLTVLQCLVPYNALPYPLVVYHFIQTLNMVD